MTALIIRIILSILGTIAFFLLAIGLYMLSAIIERKKAVKDFKKRNRPD